jgi:LacI family transcriptional regulator
MSLVDFDDVSWMSIVQPTLTAVAQPAAEIGRTAADLLLARMTGEAAAEPHVVRLAPTRVVRSSPGRPPAR